MLSFVGTTIRIKGRAARQYRAVGRNVEVLAVSGSVALAGTLSGLTQDDVNALCVTLRIAANEAHLLADGVTF